MHTEISLALPVQLWPPFEGGGLSHCRVRVWFPAPHVSEQVPNALHCPQTPSTVARCKGNESDRTRKHIVIMEITTLYEGGDRMFEACIVDDSFPSKRT